MASAAAEVATAAEPGAYAPLDASGIQQLQAATHDIRDGLRGARGWAYLALQAVLSQYRRTVLGPWWLTLQTAAYIAGLAAVFSHLLHAGLKTFLPYVAVGFMAWALLSGLTRAASQTFVGAASTMKSARQPLSVFALRDVTIELIQFGHNIAIYVVFLAAGLVSLGVRNLIAIPVTLLILVNGFFTALWLGPLVARFRDVGPLVTSVLQLAVFFSPIFYRPENLGSRRVIVEWSPFTYFLDAFRAPLIGAPLEARTYLIALLITAGNALLGIVTFSSCRSRIPYWVA